jgi:regulatory protein
MLEEAALRYLDRRACSVVQMKRLLDRRIKSWERRATRAGLPQDTIGPLVTAATDGIEIVIARLQSHRFLDDRVFAQNRAERLTRAGKSRRAVAAHLAHNGIDASLAREVTPQDDATELGAAVALLRKKRMGAFCRTESTQADAKERHRWLGSLARAGFSFSIAERALRLDREAALAVLQSTD